MHQMASLKNTLNQVMQQNSSLRSKLQQINLISQVDDLPQIPSIGITDTMIRGFGNPSLSYRYDFLAIFGYFWLLFGCFLAVLGNFASNSINWNHGHND